MTLGWWGHYGCVKILTVVTLGPWLNLDRGDIKAVVTLR